VSVHILTFDLLRQFWNVPKFFCKKYKWTNKVDLFNTGCEKLNQNVNTKQKSWQSLFDKHIFTFSEKPTKVPQPPRHFYNRSPVLESKKRLTDSSLNFCKLLSFYSASSLTFSPEPRYQRTFNTGTLVLGSSLICVPAKLTWWTPLPHTASVNSQMRVL